MQTPIPDPTFLFKDHWEYSIHAAHMSTDDLWVDFKVWVSKMHRNYEKVYWKPTPEWFREIKPLQDKETSWYRKYHSVQRHSFEADQSCYELLIMPAVIEQLEICKVLFSNRHSSSYGDKAIYERSLVAIGKFERTVEEKLQIAPRIPHPPAAPFRKPAPCRECNYQPKTKEDAYWHLCDGMKPGMYR